MFKELPETALKVLSGNFNTAPAEDDPELCPNAKLLAAMKVFFGPRVPELAELTEPCQVNTHALAIWQQLRTWQAAGLVSVKPIERDRAEVAITEAGRDALAKVRAA